MLALYGHPFSSYTWKAQIALHANDTPYELRVVDPEDPDHGAFLHDNAGPWGKFPVLRDRGAVIFESTSIIEYLDRHHPGPARLIPADPDAALAERTLDRVFDNYVMEPMSAVVAEHIRAPGAADAARCDEARDKLARSYAWLEQWLAGRDAAGDAISLIECAAAPALFYADWVAPIADSFPLLKAWRAHLLALPAVSRCVEAARPFRAWFPPGAPDRD